MLSGVANQSFSTGVITVSLAFLPLVFVMAIIATEEWLLDHPDRHRAMYLRCIKEVI